VLVLGHGGAGFPGINNHYAPNSEESIKQVLLMQGADGVEVDIQLTRDSQIVLFHDINLETITDATGFVSDKDWNELEAVSYKRAKTAINNKQSLWRLEDLLQFVDQNSLDVWLSLSIQRQEEVLDPLDYNRRFREALKRLLVQYNISQKVIVESRNVEMLSSFQTLKPLGVMLFHTTKFITQSHVDVALQNSFDGFVVNFLDESQESIDLVRANDLKLVLYGLKIRKDILPALRFRPEMVQTDNVPLVLSYLGE
jgi:glycerophosphoryl diester phosphodiesterase